MEPRAAGVAAERIVERVDVWAANIPDEPGGLSRVLKALRESGANLDFIISRRSPDEPGRSVVFVTPLRGDRQVEAAGDLGFHVASSLYSVRVEGENGPGTAAEITERLAKDGINLRGFSAAVIGTRYIVYMAFDSAQDAVRAEKVLRGG